MSHQSIRSGANSVTLFSRMFPDSEIAKSMKLQRTKLSYSIVYGLAPYFFDALKAVITQCEFFVVGFDESLNKIAQRGQMDIVVKFYSPECQQICTRYYNSVFLGHAKATDILDAFLQGTKGMNLMKMLQVSMDGPNVNLSFIKKLQDFLKDDDECPLLLDLGSCGLHTIHNAFKNAIQAVGWAVAKFLRATYNLFHHVPCRRADFIEFTKSTLFPLPFCGVRWVENGKVAERCVKVVPYLKIYVAECEKRKCEPTCESYKTVKESLNDPLLLLKLMTFQQMAEKVEPFLRNFQSDEPMSPYLYRFIKGTVHSIMDLFIKPDVLAASTNISTIDLKKQDNLISVNDLSLSFSVKQYIKMNRKCISDKNILLFRTDFRRIMQVFCEKVNLKSPLKTKLCKAISFLDPTVAKHETLAKNRLNDCLLILLNSKRIDSSEADRAEAQFKEVYASEDFKEIKNNKRLDHLWLKDIIKEDKQFKDLRKVVTIVLTLSHGNAALERGFSINKEILIENQLESSLIAQRQVYDGVINSDGIQNIKIDRPFIQSYKSARGRYEVAQKEKRDDLLDTERKKEETKFKKIRLLELEKEKETLITKTNTDLTQIENEIKKLQK